MHSSGGVAKLKPAIEALIQKYTFLFTPHPSPGSATLFRRHDLVAELDPDNAGVLIVQLDGRGSGRRTIGADEVTRRLEKPGDGCVIM